jgi:hypothetical protein
MLAALLVSMGLQAAADAPIAAAGLKRSSKWPSVRAAWLKANPKCAACGSAVKVEVHHMHPFHLFPERELDPTNFITLCEGRGGCNCHLTFGHCGNWSHWNESVVGDARYFAIMLAEAKTGPV